MSEARNISSPSVAPDVRIHELEEQLAVATEKIARLEQERARLKDAYDRLWEEIALIKHRMFVAKADRVDTSQLELEFTEKLQQLDAIAGTLGMGKDPSDGGSTESDTTPDQGEDESSDQPAEGSSKPKRPRKKPKGRRDLKDAPLEEIRLEMKDDLFESLVAEGKAKRIGFEESYKIAWQRGGMRRLVMARIKYQLIDEEGKSTIETTPMPAELLPRCLAAASMLAHSIIAKYNDGLPFWRLEDIFTRDGFGIDRGTMCRWAEEIGGILGSTVVEAMRRDALQNAFCIASDATGIAVQPDRVPGQARQPCRRGHYFAMIADRDHIWFEYTARETSAAVHRMFEGFSGYVQVDAKSVFDVLFREESTPLLDNDEPDRRVEVGCWSHARRKYWEAAFAGSLVAREALARIARIFELDASWKDKPPEEIKQLRQQYLRPHLEGFLDWATAEYEAVRDVRGPLSSALGYTVRQRQALARVLEDGRLKLDNNYTELVLRGRIAVGRKAWLFVGSDAHAETAAGIMSVIASARLHKLDPETYLRDLLRVLPHWPRDRYLELAPKFWAATRARLDPRQLGAELGELTIPDPLPSPTPEQPAPN